MEIKDFPSKTLKKSFESAVKASVGRESRNKSFFFLGLCSFNFIFLYAVYQVVLSKHFFIIIYVKYNESNDKLCNNH